MATTSLSEQLKRLQRPQTSQFVDLRKRPSILFDGKEAAEKDRETIFEIGISGLQELMQLNADFGQFEFTLFDRSSKDLVRSVETNDVNKLLAKQIRRFLHYLSPFFMLQPAHKCLEWLIRRYSIEAYDRDDFVMLILPYHGTRIFVRCVQIIDVAGTRWDWLDSVKKSGVPLAKQTLFNRLASDQALIQAITKGTLDMVKTLDVKSYTLQTAFAFYCTSMLGCLENASQVTESHFTNMLPGILKGLSSSVVDFASAAIIILGDLLGRTTLASDTLDILVNKLIAVNHPSLQEEALLLLILLFQTQGQHYKLIPQAALDELLKSKTFLPTLAELSAAQYRVSPLFVPILTVCLRRVQEKTDDFASLKNFCESCLLFVVLSDADAKEVIRCVLSSYVLKEAIEDAVITIDSGDESDIPLSDTNLDVSLWYSSFVRSIERQYPEILSLTMKEILAVDSSILSQQRKSSLKAVLGFLLTNSVQEDGHIDLFEGLFHRQSKCRVHAVRTLVSRFDEIQGTSERTRDLIQSTLKERLYDDDSRVVNEVLKLSTEALIEHVSEGEVLKRAFQVLNKSVAKTNNKWPKVKQRFLNHLLLFPKWTLVTPTELFVQLFPLLMPRQDNEIQLCLQFTSQANAQKNWPFLQKINQKSRKKEEATLTIDDIHAIVQEELKQKTAMIVPLDELIEFCEKNNEAQSHAQIYFALKLMRLEKNKTDLATTQRILNVLDRFLQNKQVTAVAFEDVSKDVVPATLVLQLMQDLINGIQLKGKFSEIHFQDTKEEPIVQLMKSFFQQIVRHMFEPSTSHIIQFGEVLQVFFKKMFENEEEVSNFLANYFASHKLVVSPVDVEVQMMAICIVRAMMKQHGEILVSDEGIIKILIGLYHDSTAVKAETMKCVEILSEKGPVKWQKICGVLAKNKAAILMDKEQIPFVIFNHVKGGKAIDPTLKCFLDVIVRPSTPDYVKATGLILIRHVNNAETVRILADCVSEVFANRQANGATLNVHEMTIMEEIINRLNQSTLIVTARNKEIWEKIIVRILDNADLFLDDEENSFPPPFMNLLEVMDEEMFSNLNADHQTEFLRSCLRNCCTSKNQTVFSHGVAKMVKALPLNGKVVETLLEEMIVNPNVSPKDGTRARRTVRIEQATTDLLMTENWRRGIVLLEMLQNKEDLANMQVVVPPLFKILKMCIDFDEQNPVEYVKQLVLASLLHCAQQLREKLNKIEGGLKVDLVVNCIRGSVNPQTHHHALQLICQLAPFAPEVVLQNITDIFTFMGSTVVRRDDAYSFQIILKIIDSVVPILIQKSEGDSRSVAVLKIFADIILDVPEHRRQAMYVRLFTTLDKHYLWVFVAIVLANYVLQEKPQDKASSNDGKDELPKSIRIALSILTEFEPVIVVETVCHLLDYMQTFQVDGEQEKRKPKRASNFEEALELAIFDSSKCTMKQQKHMKYVLIQFISNTTSAPAFIRAVSGRQQDEEEFKRIKPFYQEFIIKDLMCIANMAQVHATAQKNYWKFLLHHCYESLNNLIVLLTNQMFFAVVEGLLKHTIWTVRKKMLELLMNKFQKLIDEQTLSGDDQGALVRLLDPLEQIIITIREGSIGGGAQEENRCSSNEMLVIQQLALIVTKLMGKLLAENYPEEVTKVLRLLIDLLQHRKEIPVVVLSANVLCIADLSVNVGASAIEFLPVFMPIFLEILDTQTYNTTVDTILASMLTALQKVVETFAIFLSAYLVDILVSLALLSVKLQGIAQKDGKVNATIARIGQMEEKIAKYNPLRILVPAVEAAYKKLIVQPKAVDAIGPLMSVLAKSIADVAPQEIYGVQIELTNFFLEALQFRSTYGANKGLSLNELNAIEDRIVATLISLTLKLSESTFKPLYFKIYDWAIRDGSDAEKPERTITFYR